MFLLVLLIFSSSENVSNVLHSIARIVAIISYNNEQVHSPKVGQKVHVHWASRFHNGRVQSPQG